MRITSILIFSLVLILNNSFGQNNSQRDLDHQRVKDIINSSLGNAKNFKTETTVYDFQKGIIKKLEKITAH